MDRFLVRTGQTGPTRSPKPGNASANKGTRLSNVSANGGLPSQVPSVDSSRSREDMQSDLQSTRNRPTTKPGNPRIAVLLSASPSKDFAVDELATDSDDIDILVSSDVTGRFRQKAAAIRTLQRTSSPTQPADSVKPTRTTTRKAETPSSSAPTSTSTGPATEGRGRPKGWRPGMSYAKMRGHQPPLAGARPPRQAKTNAPPIGHPKRRGRPPKQSSPPPQEIYRQLDPPFVAFLCEWAGCEAELHNLDTLRRHVLLVHGDYEQVGCLWGQCARAAKPTAFMDERLFEEHVKKKHLIPFSWHIGDGPRNLSDSAGVAARTGGEQGNGGEGGPELIPDYLKDAEGNQVTPSVLDQEVEDYVTWRENRRKLKDLLIRRDENLPSEEESDVMDGDEMDTT